MALQAQEFTRKKSPAYIRSVPLIRPSAYSSNLWTLLSVAKLQSIRAGNVDFNVMRLDEQVVVLRVHWLPLYYDNLLLSEVLEPFGQNMMCNMLKTAHAEYVTYDGVREVYLKTTEILKQRIPHLIHL